MNIQLTLIPGSDFKPRRTFHCTFYACRSNPDSESYSTLNRPSFPDFESYSILNKSSFPDFESINPNLNGPFTYDFSGIYHLLHRRLSQLLHRRLSQPADIDKLFLQTNIHCSVNFQQPLCL